MRFFRPIVVNRRMPVKEGRTEGGLISQSVAPITMNNGRISDLTGQTSLLPQTSLKAIDPLQQPRCLPWQLRL